MATIKDIAQLARVSTATVSHVVNNTSKVSPKLQARVMKIIRELNYEPNVLARSLVTRRTKTIGMVIPDITHHLYPVVVRGAEDILGAEGYTVLVGNTDLNLEKEERYYRTFVAKRVDGLILMTCPTDRPPAYLFRHNAEKVPAVLINRDYPGLECDAVIADNLEGSYQAVRHLLEQGHRRVAVVGGPSEHVIANQRLEGYKRALREDSLPLNQELMVTGNMDSQSGYQQTQLLLGLREHPSALFVANAPMAMGALRALLDAGIRCPQDMALVSFDDMEWFSLIQPRISAVAQPAYELGAAAGRALMERISGKVVGSPRRHILETKLVIRESSIRQ